MSKLSMSRAAVEDATEGYNQAYKARVLWADLEPETADPFDGERTTWASHMNHLLAREKAARMARKAALKINHDAELAAVMSRY